MNQAVDLAKLDAEEAIQRVRDAGYGLTREGAIVKVEGYAPMSMEQLIAFASKLRKPK